MGKVENASYKMVNFSFSHSVFRYGKTRDCLVKGLKRRVKKWGIKIRECGLIQI